MIWDTLYLVLLWIFRFDNRDIKNRIKLIYKMELNLDSNIYNKKVQTTETEPAIQNITDNKI